jgi:hypothetical protein
MSIILVHRGSGDVREIRHALRRLLTVLSLVHYEWKVMEVRT